MADKRFPLCDAFTAFDPGRKNPRAEFSDICPEAFRKQTFTDAIDEVAKGPCPSSATSCAPFSRKSEGWRRRSTTSA